MKIDLIALNCRYSHSCLALFYVRNELVQHLKECKTNLLQLTINDPYYETLLRLSNSAAEYLFFSVYIWNADYVRRLIDDLSHTKPEQKIVLGGPHAAVFTNLPETCSVVLGEIEGLNATFYEDLAAAKLSAIYQARPPKSFASPYCHNDFNVALKNRHIYYESSRGCPFSCAYCLSSLSRGTVSLPIEQVTKELSLIIEHNPKIIKFVDRTFNADPERTLAIWNFLASQPGDTIFHFEIAPDLFSEEMFLFLAEFPTGKFQFEIGIQSTNPAALKAVNRMMNIDLARDNISRLVALDNIHLHLDLILGLPYETTETYHQSVNTVFSLKPHYVQMGLLKVLPGTKISLKAAEYGIVSCQNPPYQVTATSWLDHSSLSHLYWLGECIEAFYNNRYFRNFFSYLGTTGFDYATLFEEVLNCSLEADIFHLAKTQRLLNAVLVNLIANHPDRCILKELLIFDWLSCGHRYLPEELDDKAVNTCSDYLWHKMPLEVPGLFSPTTRNRFFKKGIFYQFSVDLLKATGAASQETNEGYICFLPEQKEGIFNRNKALLVA